MKFIIEDYCQYLTSWQISILIMKELIECKERILRIKFFHVRFLHILVELSGFFSNDFDDIYAELQGGSTY